MKPEHLRFLICPKTERPLQIKFASIVENSRIKEGVLVEQVSGHEYKIVNFIPRFVPQENYARNFGVEWNMWAPVRSCLNLADLKMLMG